MTLQRNTLAFEHVTFEWDDALHPLFEDLSVHIDHGWTGVIGANGAGKSTFLALAAGRLAPRTGSIRRSGEVELCQQKTEEAPDSFDEMICAQDGYAHKLCGQLHIDSDWPWRWSSLSHGERKRAQIAVALWRRPLLLAIDEPTNHLDSDARRWLLDTLRSYRGVGLIVSHDRHLLDELCRGCLFLQPPSATYRPGSYSDGIAQATLERRSRAAEREKLTIEAHRLCREGQRRRRVADGAKGRLSKKHLHRKDSSSRAKIDGARLTGKDKRASQLAKRLESRAAQARTKAEEVRVDKERELGIQLPGARSKRDLLLRCPGGELSLGEDRRLNHPELVLRPDDRIALVGPNGAGKSTLLAKLIRHCPLPEERIIFLPQELDEEASSSIVEMARALSRDEQGQVMTIISRLGSNPKQLIHSDTPSPGELRKLLLALGMSREPHLIVMDEPTNHLDLPSIECLEAALEDIPSGLLLVSHDQRLLESLCRSWWRIDRSRGELEISTPMVE